MTKRQCEDCGLRQAFGIWTTPDGLFVVYCIGCAQALQRRLGRAKKNHLQLLQWLVVGHSCDTTHLTRLYSWSGWGGRECKECCLVCGKRFIMDVPLSPRPMTFQQAFGQASEVNETSTVETEQWETP